MRSIDDAQELLALVFGRGLIGDDPGFLCQHVCVCSRQAYASLLDPEIATVSQEQAALSLRETLAEWRDFGATEQVLKKDTSSRKTSFPTSPGR